MIPGSKGRKSDASLLAGGFLTLGLAKNMSKKVRIKESVGNMERIAQITRNTNETKINMTLNLDGLSQHNACILNGMMGIHFQILPMDEALVICALDLCGRPYLVYDLNLDREKVGDLETEMVREFFYAVSYGGEMNLHLRQMSGSNNHHIIEAAFKAFAKALDGATGYDPRLTDVLSTKGSL